MTRPLQEFYKYMEQQQYFIGNDLYKKYHELLEKEKKSEVINKREMKPIGNYILINIIEEEIETSSGLILSGEEANQLRYKKAEVVEVGTDVKVIASGDTIYYDSRAGYTMMINSESYTIIRETDVVVVL